MRSKKHPWTHSLDCDERPILQQLKDSSWDPETCLSRTHKIVDALALSLHFNSQNNWGLLVSSQEIHAVGIKFYRWMQHKKQWSNLELQWKSREEGPWSLYLSLSRYFLRFKKEQLPKEKQFFDTEPSYSAKRTLLELPPPRSLPQQMTETLLDSFSLLTLQLPEELRLCYQLHLEGLVNPEISVLLQLSIDDVEKRITEAKHQIKGEIRGTRVS